MFGQKLRELRKAKGLTQVALAKASAMPVGTIRDYEQGKREPLFSNARKIARGLGVSLDELADEDGTEEKRAGLRRKTSK